MKRRVPPVGADVEEEMMDDAVAEGGGDDFAGDGVLNDEGDAAAGMIITAEDAVAEVNEVFHIVEFKAMFVYGVFLAFAGGEVGGPEFAQEEGGEVGRGS